MAHYAFLDEQGIVTEVIVGNDETTGDWEAYYSAIRGQRCLRTSYHSRIRGCFAGIGFRYDDATDTFLPPEVTHGTEATETAAGGDSQP